MRRYVIVCLVVVMVAQAAIFTHAQAASQNYWRYVSVGSATCNGTKINITNQVAEWNITVPNVTVAFFVFVNGATVFSNPNQPFAIGSSSSSNSGFWDQGTTYTYTLESFAETKVNGVAVYRSQLIFTCSADGTPDSVVIKNTDLTTSSGTPTTITSPLAPVPGCDLGMPIGNTSVVGTFLTTSETYWQPGDTTDTVIDAGKTAWVLGMDESGEYYQIVWSCDLLWVPVENMGPTFDDVWGGMALPTEVVE